MSQNSPPNSPPRLAAVFRAIIRWRWLVLAFYAALLVPSVYYAIKVEQDNAPDRLILESDPDFKATRAFEQVFGNAEYVIVLFEAPDPFQPDVLARFSQIEDAIARIDRVRANSLLGLYRRAKAGFTPSAESAAAFKQFAQGSPLFKRQGLYGDNFLSIPIVIHNRDSVDRQHLLSQIDAVLAPAEQSPVPFSRIRKVGLSYVHAYLDRDTRETGMRYFPLFFLFVVLLNLSLYRSLRALLAFVVTLGVCAAATVGYVGLTGGVFTIVSSVVPMTILITCTATLVYLHSRFVDHPTGVSVEDHQIFALCNKFLACTASIFAAAVGFAALIVSKIRPIREMGIWVAIGLMITWFAVFTLFPALQAILKTPTQQGRVVGTTWFDRLAMVLPRITYRFRWPLVLGTVAMSLCGAVALFGLKPVGIAPMYLQTNSLEYIPHDSDLYKNTKELGKILSGLDVVNLWIRPTDEAQRSASSQGALIRPALLRALDDLQNTLERQPKIGSVTSLATILRTLRYLKGKGDALPTDEEDLEKMADDLEQRLPSEPMLGSFLDVPQLTQTHFAVVTQAHDYESFEDVKKSTQLAWQEVLGRHPVLKSFEFRLVGLAPLQAKISYHMVPTLIESFALTVAIIFVTFLLVFRSGIARIMAMIPSFFAILVMFLIMRVTGVFLNVATILIATTVLGTSENDQIHFFYHFQEGRKEGTVEQAMRHTLLISGRAILYATLINAGGFLAFALATLPPIRQFGMLSSLAFALSMIADFTALPAALWLLFRKKPDGQVQ